MISPETGSQAASRPSSTLDQGRFDETCRWLDAALGGRPIPPLLIVIGLEDGDLLDVLTARAPRTRVVALEPSPAAALHFLQRGDRREWFENGRLVYLTDPDYAGADDAWRAFPATADAHKLIVSPAVTRDGGPAALRAAKVAKQIIFGAVANADARRRFAPRYLSGTLHNIPEIAGGRDLRGLTDFYRGCPAVIAGAGPSLDSTLDELGDAAGRCVIIASDTALRPMLHRGVSPDIVVAVDPQALNARHFHALPECSRTWLVTETSIDPTVLAPFDARTMWFRVAHHHPWPWCNEIGIDVARLDVWGSVLTAAFQVAVLAGCDPIVMVGADLAFTGGHPYCRGTTYEFDWAYGAANGHPLDRAWLPFLKPDEQIRLTDMHGRETMTSGYLQSFRDWLVARAARSGRRIINAGGAGLFFGEGIEQRPLAEAIAGQAGIPSLDAMPVVRPSSQPLAVIASKLRTVRAALDHKTASLPIDQWKHFTGDGFSADATAAALDRAAQALASGAPDPRTDSPVIPWPSLSDSDAVRRVVPQMPEAMARLRAAFGHADAIPPLADPVCLNEDEQAACFRDALTILRAIHASMPRAGDLAAPIAPDSIGHVPLGSLLSWPQIAGWAVRLFEGLLGATIAAPLPPGHPTFFSKPVTPRDAAVSGAPRPLGPTTHPHTEQALIALACEWLLCARARDAARWRGLAEAASVLRDSAAGHSSVTLVLDAGSATPLDLPLPIGEARLARVLTGTVISTGAAMGRARAGSRLGLASAAASPAVELRLGDRTGAGPVIRTMLTPRILTDERAPKAFLSYTAGGCVVCTSMHAPESFLVNASGGIDPYLSWPRAVNGQLPWGADGAVAWSVGHAKYPGGGRGYVMYRNTSAEQPAFEELPFGPQAGAWWRERIYWACFPFGLGSWAPGGAAAFALPDVTLFSVNADDDALELAPRTRTVTGAPERKLVSRGWRWTPDGSASPIDLGSRGAATSRAAHAGWTATAYPEADEVALTHADGRSVCMTCYYPFGVAWAGSSLVVSTTDGELLLFEDFIAALSRLGGAEACA